MPDPAPVLSLSARAPLASLYSVCVLSMMMFDGRDEEQILRLAGSSVPTLAVCRNAATYQWKDGVLRPFSGDGGETLQTLLHLGGEQGQVRVPGAGWATAYPLCGLGDNHGYLVLTADREPSAQGRFLVSVLAKQTGAALASAAVRRSERQQSEQLNILTSQLRSTISELRERQRVHETLIRACATRNGERGIAAAVHQLTGMPIGIEDQFGHVQTWLGSNDSMLRPAVSASNRAALVDQAQRRPGPVRDGDRLVAFARSRGELLGALVLLDPGGIAGEQARFALEEGATMLALELVHQQTLAETELRLRRDLVDDLLAGTVDPSVFARARNLGHDLEVPHRALVINWNGQADEATVNATQRAASRLKIDYLLTRRSGLVVLLVHQPGDWRTQRPWDQLYSAIEHEMPSPNGAIGVGGHAAAPADIARSYQEAQQALAIRQRSRSPYGVTAFEDLGIYRLLSSEAPFQEADRFVKEWLGALVGYDERHHSELVRTLSLYLEYGGNYDSTAKALQIHRSTLRYRLQRIRDISHRDLNDPHHRLNLHIATQAWHILQGIS